ncbi:MAG: hypothetical protein ACRCV5_23700 [Afipia sp.]
MYQIIRDTDGAINVDATIAQTEADRRRRIQVRLAQLDARWDQTPDGQRYAAWRVGWNRRLRILQISTIIEVILLVVWFVLAWNDNPAAPAVFALQFPNAIVPVYIIVWSFKEL